MQNKDKLMGEGKILPLLIRFSLPATVGMAVNSLYNIIDRIFVGNAVGKVGLAAITAVFPISTFIMALSVLSGMGCSTLVAIRLGQGDKEGAQSVLNHTVLYIVVVASVTSLLGIIFINPILKLLGVADDVLEYAVPYARVIISFSVFTYIAFGLNHTIRSTGKPIIAMCTVLVGGILNIILDYILVIRHGLGITGAAWSNSISQAVASLLVVFYFAKPSSVTKISFKKFRFNFQQILEIVKIGSAQSLMQFVTAVIAVVLNKTVIRYISAEALASAGIYTSVLTLLTVPAMGISQGMQSLIGYNFGAKKKKRVISFYLLAMGLSFLLTIVATAATMVFAPQIVAMFGKGVPDMAVMWIRRGLVLSALSAAVIVTTGYFQAKGMQGKALVTALFRQVVFYVPLLYILPKFFGI